ncbi:MAG: hypothetical protein FWE80_02165 [Oscillospiraceae bacterium]|nr:hypothetical protein [Oscillospiraceae bacterium]
MKKLIALTAVAAAVCLMLTGLTASAAAGKTPQPIPRRDTIIKQFLSGEPKPLMDGQFSVLEWGEKLFTLNQKLLDDGAGHIWTNLSKNLEDPQHPVPVEGDFHMGWDKDHIYFALVMKNVGHYQQQGNPEYLWKEDCLQIQIGADTSGQAERFEFSFAYSVGFEKPLGYRSYPRQQKLDVPEKESDRMFCTSRNNDTRETIYEARLHRSVFGRKTEMRSGDVIPFAFALHVYDPYDWYNPEVDDGPGAGPRGCFYEWGEGVVGGAEEKTLDVAAWVTLGADPILKLKPGHVSGGEKLGVEDARLVLQHLIGKAELLPWQLDAAKVSGKNNVTVDDARLILQRIVGKISKFPVEG